MVDRKVEDRKILNSLLIVLESKKYVKFLSKYENVSNETLINLAKEKELIIDADEEDFIGTFNCCLYDAKSIIEEYTKENDISFSKLKKACDHISKLEDEIYG